MCVSTVKFRKGTPVMTSTGKAGTMVKITTSRSRGPVAHIKQRGGNSKIFQQAIFAVDEDGTTTVGVWIEPAMKRLPNTQKESTLDFLNKVSTCIGATHGEIKRKLLALKFSLPTSQLLRVVNFAKIKVRAEYSENSELWSAGFR